MKIRLIKKFYEEELRLEVRFVRTCKGIKNNITVLTLDLEDLTESIVGRIDGFLENLRTSYFEEEPEYKNFHLYIDDRELDLRID